MLLCNKCLVTGCYASLQDVMPDRIFTFLSVIQSGREPIGLRKSRKFKICAFLKNSKGWPFFLIIDGFQNQPFTTTHQ